MTNNLQIVSSLSACFPCMFMTLMLCLYVFTCRFKGYLNKKEKRVNMFSVFSQPAGPLGCESRQRRMVIPRMTQDSGRFLQPVGPEPDNTMLTPISIMLPLEGGLFILRFQPIELLLQTYYKAKLNGAFLCNVLPLSRIKEFAKPAICVGTHSQAAPIHLT